MKVNMFDIYYANLSNNTIGSEQGGIRPVVVMQNNIGNKYSPTIIIIPITSEIKKINIPTHCILHKSRKNGLVKESMALGEQLRMIDKSRLLYKIGQIDNQGDKDSLINIYIANITGKKRYTTFWTKIVNLFFRLVREGEDENAA